MEKFNNFETQFEQEPSVPEKVRRTNTVLAKLALWGVIAFNPLQATETKIPELDNRDDVSTAQISKEDVNKKVHAFENRFKESGLISPETQHEKPVIVVLSKDSIEANYSGKNGFVRTIDDFLSQTLILNFVNQGVDVVERGTGATNALLKEAALGETGLIEWDQRVKLGNWSSADYYVVSSTRNGGRDSSLFVFTNEIINMKDGSSTIVSVESTDKYSDASVTELAKKTESVIEEIESQKNEQ